MKPRIHPYEALHSLMTMWVNWRCFGAGRAGFGKSPAEAYRNWVRRCMGKR